MSNLLTSSRMKTRRDCARKHFYMYEQGYRPVSESEALVFGILFHRAAESWWRSTKAGITGENRLGFAKMVITEYATTPFERARGLALIQGYDMAHAHKTDDYEVIDVEAKFDLPMINPDTMMPSRTWRLAGKIDVIVRDKRTGRVAVVEHKTTSESIDNAAEGYLQRLSMDHQISMYVVGAMSKGFEIQDTIYDVIKKPQLRPYLATPIENRKYRADGALYANLRDRDETPDEFHSRVLAAVIEDTNKFFLWHPVPRLDSQIKDFMWDTWEIGKEIRDSHIANRSPRNPEACFRFGRCAFWDVCANGVDLETSYLFKKLDTVHPELAD